MNNLSLVNIFGETGRFFYNINYMLNSEHLSLVNKIGDKTEFTITRAHCTTLHYHYILCGCTLHTAQCNFFPKVTRKFQVGSCVLFRWIESTDKTQMSGPDLHVFTLKFHSNFSPKKNWFFHFFGLKKKFSKKKL